MRLVKFLVLSFLLLFTSAVLAQKSTATVEALAGSWRLVSVETIRPGGEIIFPFYGKHPSGLLIYDRSGWMSVEIVSDPAPTVPTPSSREKFEQAAAAEKAAAIDGFYRTTVHGQSATVGRRSHTTSSSRFIRESATPRPLDGSALRGTV